MSLASFPGIISFYKFHLFLMCINPKVEMNVCVINSTDEFLSRMSCMFWDDFSLDKTLKVSLENNCMGTYVLVKYFEN